MGYIVSLLRKLDAAIQKRFDSICFSLMRRFGVRKSMIRYALSAVGIACASSAAFYGVHATSSTIVAVILAILGIRCGLGLLWFQHDVLHEDARVEQSPGTRSRADEYAFGAFKLAWLVLCCAAWCVASGIVSTPLFSRLAAVDDREFRLMSCGVALFWLIRLALEYLKKTPMNPPAEKAREHVGTPQTAPART